MRICSYLTIAVGAPELLMVEALANNPHPPIPQHAASRHRILLSRSAFYSSPKRMILETFLQDHPFG
jgi:hypothetical protein